MEKEQIKEAYSNGYEAGWDSEDWVPEKYYNDCTFNTKMREVTLIAESVMHTYVMNE